MGEERGRVEKMYSQCFPDCIYQRVNDNISVLNSGVTSKVLCHRLSDGQRVALFKSDRTTNQAQLTIHTKKTFLFFKYKYIISYIYKCYLQLHLITFDVFAEWKIMS